MPTLKVHGQSLEVSERTRLVAAIKDAGVAIGHRCGGKGRCTTCRVTFVSGEPGTFTKAEFAKLGLSGNEAPEYRLSCQIFVRPRYGSLAAHDPGQSRMERYRPHCC